MLVSGLNSMDLFINLAVFIRLFGLAMDFSCWPLSVFKNILLHLFFFVCVCVRERDMERQRDTETDRQRERGVREGFVGGGESTVCGLFPSTMCVHLGDGIAITTASTLSS